MNVKSLSVEPKTIGSARLSAVVVIEHNLSRRRTGMQPAVEVVLADDSSASIQHGRL